MLISRPAIAMIELIFAIVILGITLMSAPMLISQATTSGITAIQQEAIAAAASEIGMIMTRQWDEQDTDETAQNPILVVNNGHTDLDEATYADGNRTGRRIGTPSLSSRSFLTSLGGARLNATPAATLGPEGGDDDDIDDFNGRTVSLTVITATDTVRGDYADTSLQLNITVNYLLDSPTSDYQQASVTYSQPFTRTTNTSTNIKAVSVQATSGSHDDALKTNVLLRAFTCNIGTYTLKEGRF
jgi:hypothetical protein